MKRKLFSLLLIAATAFTAVACSDDDDKPNIPKDKVDGTYYGDMDIEVDGTHLLTVPQKVSITKVSNTNDRVKLEIKNFSILTMNLGTITVEDVRVNEKDGKYTLDGAANVNLNDVGNCDIKIGGYILDGTCNLLMNVIAHDLNQTIKVDFTGDRSLVELNSEALITSFKFNSDSVKTSQILGNQIVFYPNVEMNNFRLSPTIEISKGATISPASGTEQNFADTVQYTVTSEDGMKMAIYKVYAGEKTVSYNMEEWIAENPGQAEENTIYAPTGGWSSSNAGALFLKPNYVDRFCVTKSDDKYSGNYAARIETLDSKGANIIIAKIPKVTTGTLFLGAFKTDLTNTLKSTKFGILSPGKPTKVKGYYKYTPGSDYYVSDKVNSHIAAIDNSKEDSCAINAILYEITDETNFNLYLTGADAYVSDKLTGIAKLADGSSKADYTPFEINFEYLKPYDPAKKYMVSIICSSSKAGDTFSGAPGSVLFVDDIELIFE